jgi:hypothetical protein
MLIRKSLMLLGLAAVAGTAFAATPQAATTPAPAKSSAAVKSEHKDKRTCEERSKATGHCEKWANAKTSAKPAKPAKT